MDYYAMVAFVGQTSLLIWTNALIILLVKSLLGSTVPCQKLRAETRNDILSPALYQSVITGN